MLALAGCSAAAATGPNATALREAPKAVAILPLNRAHEGVAAGRFQYFGKWQFVRGLHDGRLNGQSVRSYRAGDYMIFAFTGRQVRLFGTLGRKGGVAMIGVDARRPAAVSFYAPDKQTHAVIYTSARLPYGDHGVAIVVSGQRPQGSAGTYVNLEDAAVIKQ